MAVSTGAKARTGSCQRDDRRVAGQFGDGRDALIAHHDVHVLADDRDDVG
jgi:hypothetical protein